MLNVNLIFRLIVLAKRQGKGKLGNGLILTRLIGTLCDFADDTEEIERRLVITPDNVTLNRYADKLMQNRVRFPFAGEPYGLPMTDFQKLTMEKHPDGKAYLHYLERMHRFCKDTLDPDKTPALVSALLAVLRVDERVYTVFYDNRHISKSDLLGSCAHPKRLCLEALLIGLWFHAMRFPSTMDARNCTLPEHPDLRLFSVFTLDAVCADPFAQPYETIRPLLDLEQTVTVHQRICEVTPELQDTGSLQPMEIACHGQILPSERLMEISQDHLLLIADGAMGKTTLLRRQKGFYLPLEHYKKEMREQLLPHVSCYLLSQILLKYYYGYAHISMDICLLCEENAALAFADLYRELSDPENAFTLLLDGVNEIASKELLAFCEEIAWIMEHLKAVRIVLSSRVVPDHPVFDAFERVEMLGISCDERDAVLTEKHSLPTDTGLLELLRSPLFLRLYLDENAERIQTRGEILDAYVQGFHAPVHDEARLLEFAVRFALPFAANTMLHSHHRLTRADLLDAVQSAKALYLDDERICQNCIAPLHFEKDKLLKALKEVDIVSLLLFHTGFLEATGQEEIRFSHQYYRDYFAAKYILNLIDTLKRSYASEPRKQHDLFSQYGLGEIWFPDDDQEEIYRLMGEICGDYQNRPDEEGVYLQETLLDDLLEMARQFPHFRMVENVMNVMRISRNGVVCGVDFSSLGLPFTMLENTYFSMNGLYPCDFRNTRVYGVFASSIPEDGNTEETVYPPEDCEKYYLNCDFSGAIFFPIDENREILRRFGAIV